MNLYKLSNYHYINPSKRAYDNFTVRFYRDEPSCLSLLGGPSQKRVPSSRWKVWRQWRMSLSLATEIEVGFKFLEGFCTGPISLLPPVTIRHLSLTHIWHGGGQRRRRRINLINVDQCWWLWFQHFGTKGQQRNLESLVIDCWIDWLICCPLNGSFFKKMHLVGIDQSTEGAGGVNWHLQTNNLPLRH